LDILIRPVRLEDAAALHEIQLQPEVLPYILPLPSLRAQDLAERLRRLGPDEHFFVAEAAGGVLGYAGLYRHAGRRSHGGHVFLAVHAAHHGQGIGTALLQKLLDLADNWLGLERVELSVLASNPAAERLYRRLGFAAEGRRRGSVLSQGMLVDEILMVRLRPGGTLAADEAGAGS
jgi:putative acetyltransferase